MSVPELRIQIGAILNDINAVLDTFQRHEQTLEQVVGGTLLLGLTDTTNPMLKSTTNLAQNAKQHHHDMVTDLLELRSRLIMYMDIL